MDINRHPKLSLARLCAVAAALCEAMCAFGGCKAPHYRIGRTLEDDSSGVFVHISMGLNDFAPERIVCLAGELKRKYPGRSVTAAIFSSREAALGYTPSTERTQQSMEYESKLHGFYFYNKDKHDDYLLIVPDPRSLESDSPFDTRIDQPLKGTPACKLSITGRCLLEFQHLYYPDTAASGRVTLAGSIRRDGVVSNLAVVDATVNPPGQKSELVEAALRNLGTWRFEPGKRKDAIRITYSFGTQGSPPAWHGMEFRLPDEVRIEN